MSWREPLRALLTGSGTLGLAAPFLFNRWIHGRSDRYLWIINQGFPCSSMGGGPFQLWILTVYPWFLALVALGAALLIPVPPETRGRHLLLGLILGLGLTGAVAALMMLTPGYFAVLLGC